MDDWQVFSSRIVWSKVSLCTLRSCASIHLTVREGIYPVGTLFEEKQILVARKRPDLSAETVKHDYKCCPC